MSVWIIKPFLYARKTLRVVFKEIVLERSCAFSLSENTSTLSELCSKRSFWRIFSAVLEPRNNRPRVFLLPINSLVLCYHHPPDSQKP